MSEPRSGPRARLPRARLIVRRLIGDLETPVAAMLKLGAEQPGSFLFESIQGGERLGRYSFIGLQPDLWWRVIDGRAETARDADFADIIATSDDPLADMRRFADLARADAGEDLPPMASGAFGYIGYDMIRHFEPVTVSRPDALGIPEAILVRPRFVIVFDHLYQEIMLVARVEPGADPDIAQAGLDSVTKALSKVTLSLHEGDPFAARKLTLSFHSNTTKMQYFEMVERAKSYIRAGDIFQVVPSQRLSASYHGRSISLYRALRRLNPSAFMFHMRLGPVQLVGSSPEILVRVRNGRIALRPIAGTRPRTGDPVVDAAAQAELLADEKELAEHLMLLDLGRNDVGRVAEFGSVEVTEQFVVERYSHVMHIVSQVEGNLREGLHPVDALMAGFPAGTVSGAPKIRAMQIIDELEPVRRGVYGGAVGYFGWRGDLDTCIALRTGVITGDTLHVQAGGGIVLDSQNEAEYAETLHKAGALMKAAELAAAYEEDQ